MNVHVLFCCLFVTDFILEEPCVQKSAVRQTVSSPVMWPQAFEVTVCWNKQDLLSLWRWRLSSAEGSHFSPSKLESFFASPSSCAKNSLPRFLITSILSSWWLVAFPTRMPTWPISLIGWMPSNFIYFIENCTKSQQQLSMPLKILNLTACDTLTFCYEHITAFCNAHALPVLVSGRIHREGTCFRLLF